jgi:hypothetical protein
MTRRLGRCTVTGLAVLIAAACSDSPASPNSGNPQIANLTATQLGLSHALCNDAFQYRVHDELTLDVLGATNTNVINATLHEVIENGTAALIGSVTSCSQNVTPCFTVPSVCLIGSGAVKRIRAYAPVPWTPTRTWRVLLRVDGVDTNVLQAQITRPDALPTGNTAAIAYLDAQRISATVGSFSFSVYSPGIAGRRFTMTTEVWANGTRLSSFPREVIENRVGAEGFGGGIMISPDPTELVGLLEERDADGNVIATDRKTTMFR